MSIVLKQSITSAIIVCFYLLLIKAQDEHIKEPPFMKQPTVLIGILIRNKAHTLPYFLTCLDRLNYPKDRISIWIKSDNNIDKSLEVLQTWLAKAQSSYHDVHIRLDETTNLNQSSKIGHWTEERFNHIIQLREEILEYSRHIWADYLLMLDADVFLKNPNVLNVLMTKNLPVVAPLLKSDGLYSNFWHGMTDDYYYERTDDYKPILNREKQGCFTVPMVHSCVLINLNSFQSDRLTYVPENVPHYTGPRDDIITFAISAKQSNVPLHVCNDENYGFIMLPLEAEDSLDHDLAQLTNLKLEVLTDEEPLEIDLPTFGRFVSIPAKHRFGFDKIYMINLLRRPERRQRMMRCFDELGLDVENIDAVDGRILNESFLNTIKFLPEYVDPYHKRPMTHGEIGCFMSHYKVWEKIVNEGHQVTLVLEDDIRFEPFFARKVRILMEELRQISNWDLVYFGRKRLQEHEEPWVPGSTSLVEVGYSYWTLGYAVSQSGARKLLAADPLKNLLPVDEYLPILFDKHPYNAWKVHYPKRDLVAFSAAPLLLYPTHYTGEAGYISDTEDSNIIRNVTENKDEL